MDENSNSTEGLRLRNRVVKRTDLSKTDAKTKKVMSKINESLGIENPDPLLGNNKSDDVGHDNFGYDSEHADLGVARTSRAGIVPLGGALDIKETNIDEDSDGSVGEERLPDTQSLDSADSGVGDFVIYERVSRKKKISFVFNTSVCLLMSSFESIYFFKYILHLNF